MKTFFCLMFLAALVCCGCATVEKPVGTEYVAEAREARTPFDKVTIQNISTLSEITIYRLDSYKDGHRLENTVFHLVIPHGTTPTSQPTTKP